MQRFGILGALLLCCGVAWSAWDRGPYESGKAASESDTTALAAVVALSNAMDNVAFTGEVNSNALFYGALFNPAQTITVPITQAAGAVDVAMPACATGTEWRVRILATNASTTVRLCPTNWPGGNYGADMRLYISNPNLRTVSWQGDWNTASNGCFSTNAIALGQYAVVGVWYSMGDQYRTMPVTNATEIWQP